jgi:hypothetical protein
VPAETIHELFKELVIAADPEHDLCDIVGEEEQ